MGHPFQALVIELYDKQVIQVGSFQLKSGITSPIYIDLRLTISYPSLLRQVVSCFQNICRSLSYDILCGVPYTALPFATLLSVENQIPMVMRRKEVKDYGTKKAIEGVFQPNQTCLIIEDLITSGSSVLETLQPLAKEGLIVKDVVVLLDREQGGKANLSNHGIRLHSVIRMTDILEILKESGRLSYEKIAELYDYFHSTQVSNISPCLLTSRHSFHHLSFEQRLLLIRNKVGRRLLEIVLKKQSNLAVAVDVTTSQELLSIADQVGPEICVLKTHADIIQDWTDSVSEQLVHLSKLHHFLIFEDRKFADIGNTVELQFTGGIFHISHWADIVNAHIIAGPGTIEALSNSSAEHCGILLLAQMSSKGNLAVEGYTQKALEFAKQYEDAVFGFISMGCIGEPNFLYFTPGVKLQGGNDSLGQQYTDPKTVIGIQNSDIAIVGRGIIQASNKKEAASTYRKACWDAYLQRMGK